MVKIQNKLNKEDKADDEIDLADSCLAESFEKEYDVSYDTSFFAQLG